MDPAVSTAEAISTGDGRQGRAVLVGSDMELELSSPLGPQGSGTNPEELFAAGFAACYHSALKHAAGQEKVRAARSTVTAKVGLHLGEEGYFLSVDLQVDLPGVPKDVAQRLAQVAEAGCPYAKATRGNIDVTITIVS